MMSIIGDCQMKAKSVIHFDSYWLNNIRPTRYTIIYSKKKPICSANIVKHVFFLAATQRFIDLV